MIHKRILALLCCAAISAHAEGPLANYLFATKVGQLNCEGTFQRVLLESVKPAEFENCIENESKTFRVAYEVALKQVKKPKAREALKEHLVQALTALKGLNPTPGERQIIYDRRQADLHARVEEAWTRFEVEL